jgi:hypothetical protein
LCTEEKAQVSFINRSHEQHQHAGSGSKWMKVGGHSSRTDRVSGENVNIANCCAVIVLQTLAGKETGPARVFNSPQRL